MIKCYPDNSCLQCLRCLCVKNRIDIIKNKGKGWVGTGVSDGHAGCVAFGTGVSDGHAGCVAFGTGVCGGQSGVRR